MHSDMSSHHPIVLHQANTQHELLFFILISLIVFC